MINALKSKHPIFNILLTNKAVLSIAFNALGKGVYFLFILLVGRLITADSKTDVYFFTVEFIKVVVGYSLLINSDVLIPQIIKLKETSPEKLERLMGFFYALYVVLGIASTVLILLFPQFFLGIFSKFTEAIISKDYSIFSFLMPILFFNILSGLQSSILIAYNYFVTPSLVIFLGNCLSLTILFFLYQQLGINAAILGIIVGGISINIILAYYLKVKCHIRYTLNFKIDFSIFKSINYVTLVYVTASICNFVLIYLLTASEETTTTAYNYASLISFIPHQFIGVQLITIMANKFAELYNTQQFDLLKAYIKRTLIGLTILILPFCIVYVFFSPTIVNIISGGDLNSENYRHKFSLLLRYFAFPAFFNSIFLCGLRLYTTTLRIRTPSIVQSIINLTLVVSNYIGFRYFNIEGLGVSVLLVYGLMFLSGIYLIVNFFKIIDKQQSDMDQENTLGTLSLENAV